MSGVFVFEWNYLARLVVLILFKNKKQLEYYRACELVLFKVIALRWDYLGLNGQGAASEPLGVLNTPGIGSVTFGATPTYIKLISFRTAIRALNVDDPLYWISTPNVEGSLAGVAEALTGATTVGGAQNAIWKPDNKVVGIEAVASNQMPNNLVLLALGGESGAEQRDGVMSTTMLVSVPDGATTFTAHVEGDGCAKGEKLAVSNIVVRYTGAGSVALNAYRFEL